MDVRDVSIPEPQDGELLIRVHPTRDFAFHSSPVWMALVS